jgi:anti-anti-sigma regulatory factor
MALANSGGALKLCCLSKKLRDIFVVTRLDTVFDIHETEAAAVASGNRANRSAP